MTTPFDTIKTAILGNPVDPKKKPSRTGVVKGFQEQQVQLDAAQSGALVFGLLSELTATTVVPSAKIMAWVIGDPVTANNGIYSNTGTAGAAVWTRRGDIPQYVISGINVGAGTANAIQITTDLPVPTADARALVIVPVLADNTISPPTVSINGGAALPIVTNSGNNVIIGGIVAGQFLLGVVAAGKFRLMSDQVSAALLALAEDAAQQAIDAASSVQSEQTSRASAIANYHPIVAPNFIRVAGYANAGDGGSALYKKVVSEPSHAGKFSITLTPSGTAWYEIAEDILTPDMLGAKRDFSLVTLTGTDNSTALANWLSVMEALGVSGRIPAGNLLGYGYATPLATDNRRITILGDGINSAFLYYTGAVDSIALAIGGGISYTSSRLFTNNVRSGQNQVQIDSTTGIVAGDVIEVRSSAAWYNDPRENPLVTSDALGQFLAGSTTTVLNLPATFAVSGSIVGQYITITSGTLKNYSRAVISYDNTLKQITVSALPSAPALNDRYAFPQCVKGITARVARVVSSTVLELRDSIADAYLVVNADPTLIRESVTVRGFNPVQPTLRDFAILYSGAAFIQGLSVARSVDVDIKVRVTGGRQTGVSVAKSVGGKVELIANTSNRPENGYGAQSFECTSIIFDAFGWNNRRVVDISGNAPSVRCVVRGLRAKGGGLQSDGQAYFPVGTIENFGTGSHGAGHNTIYEECEFEDVQYGVYERGRGAVVRDCFFGPNVINPIVHSYGGRLEVYDNVCDARIFSTLDPGVARESVSGSIANAKLHYAESFITVGGNLLNQEPESEIFVKDNFVRVRKFLVAFDIQGGSARVASGLNVSDNECEFFPINVGDENGMYGKTTTAGAGQIIIQSGRHSSEMATAVGWKAPMIANTGVIISTTTQVVSRFGDNGYSVRLANATAQAIRIGQNLKDKIRVDVSIEDDDSKYFSGWIKKNAATAISYASAGFEALATAPDGVIGGSTVFQLHYADGVLTLGNKTGFNRTFNLIVQPMI